MAKPLATLGQRIIAWIVDLIIIGIIAGIFGFFGLGAAFLAGFTGNPLAAFFSVGLMVIMFAVIFGYTIFLEGLRQGQTLGKQVIGIRVVDESSGKPIGLGQSAIRNILRIIDNQLVGLVGLILIAATKNKQRLGDIVAKTVVVKD